MNSDNLSKRLQTVADFINKYGKDPKRLADIGTDHAYLPVNLILGQKIHFAIAGDIVEGPYQSAKREVENKSLETKIHVRKGNGLEVISDTDNINIISICGMGGKLITEILDKDKYKVSKASLLVLQSNTGGHNIRQWITNQGYSIIDESIILEDNKFYEIIVVNTKSNSVQTLSPKEILLGPVNIANNTSNFVNYLKHQYNHYNRIYTSISQNATNISQDKFNQIQQNIQWIKEVLDNE